MMVTRRKLAIITMGGTIAMTGGGPDGVKPALLADDLAAAVPGLDRLAELHLHSFMNQPSTSVTMDHVQGLSALVGDLAQSGMDGVIVTHGTDTIEETAFALDLMGCPSIPVVFTGAMRNPTLIGADGPLNLYHAAMVALGDWASGLGVVAIFGEQVHAARELRKLHTTRLDAFTSQFGPVAEIGENGPRPCRTLPPLPAMPTSQRDHWPRVALIDAVMDDDGATARAVTGNGIEGLVVNGLGGGHVSPATAEVLGAVAPHIPVVMATRTRGGTVLSDTYGFVGGEIDLARRGVLRAGWLDGYKARIAMMLLLRGGADQAQIRDFLSFFDGG